MHKRGQASAATRPSSSESSSPGIFDPLKKLLYSLGKWALILILIVAVFGLAYGGTRQLIFKSQSGEIASAVVHGEVAGQKALTPAQSFAKAYLPSSFYYFFSPEQENPFAIDAQVESTAANQDLGVVIKDFKLSGNRNYFFSGEPITLTGIISAGGFQDESYDILVYCDLEGSKKTPVPATLLGPQAQGNRGTVPKGITTLFNVQCEFPDGMTITDPNGRSLSKVANLIVTYNFKTESYARMWFLNRQTLLSLQTQGIDIFERYKVSDPLLNGDKIATARDTPGPINLGINVPISQPLTSGAEYQVITSLTRRATDGNLQTLEYMEIKLPSVASLDLSISGEGSYTASASACDFEYVGVGDGYKIYKLKSDQLTRVNQNCGKQSLKDLALTEADCISLFKQPVLACNFIVTKVPPQGLQSDVISALAKYTMRDKKPLAVTVRATPQMIAEQIKRSSSTV